MDFSCLNKNFLFPTSMTFLKRKCNYVTTERSEAADLRLRFPCADGVGLEPTSRF